MSRKLIDGETPEIMTEEEIAQANAAAVMYGSTETGVDYSWKPADIELVAVPEPEIKPIPSAGPHLLYGLHHAGLTKADIIVPGTEKSLREYFGDDRYFPKTYNGKK